MRIADLTTGAAKMGTAHKTMRLHWEATKEEWQDANRRNFEERFLDPLEPQLHSAMDAIARLSEILNRAERECE